MNEALIALSSLVVMIALGVLVDSESRTIISGRSLKEGTHYPWWAGFAWYEPCSFNTVVMIIPLNYVAALSRRVWHWMQRGFKPTTFDEQLFKMYQRGINDGLTRGYRHGQGCALLSVSDALRSEFPNSPRLHEHLDSVIKQIRSERMF